MSEDYTDNNTNDLTNALRTYGETKGSERYQRSLTQKKTVTRTNDEGEKVSEEVVVDVTDVERLHVVTRIIDDAVDVVVAKIDEKVEEEAARAATDVGGQPRKGLAQIAGVDYTAAAMTALNTMWECVGKSQDRSRRVQLIGKRCESVALHQAMSDQMGYKAKPLFKKAKRSYEAKERQDSYIDYKAKRREVVFDPWDDILRTYVGATLHDAVMEASGLFIEVHEIIGRGKRAKSKWTLSLSDEATEARRKGNAKAEWMRPLLTPMGQPPVGWSSYQGGPYPDERSRNVHLVRGMKADQRAAINDALANNDMPLVIEAVNHIQDVPFEINLKAWEVVRWCFDNGREPCDSFPPLTEVPVEMVTDLTTLAAANDNGDADTDARIKMRDAIKHNLAVRSHLVTTSYLTDMVETIGDLPFWLPHNFDFRSRMYPVPVINYQSADHIKALHYFVLRKPLGERGLMWLYAHIAGCADYEVDGKRLSKMPLQDRVDWATENEDMLLDIARNWRDRYDLWSSADKPFSFVVGCMELLAAIEHFDAYGNWEYLCGLPVSIDGSCSGYQHYSAAMRAEREARLVNLIPSDEPQDIYQFIADAVTVQVEADANAVTDADCTCDEEDGDCPCCKKQLAKLWLNKVTRKVCKRPVMTSGYNSNAYGFTDQIIQDVMEKLNRRVVDPKDEMTEHPFAFGDDRRGFKAAKYLAQIIHDMVRANLSAATDGMDFFKAHLNAWSKRGEHFCMLSPLGFPFFQAYQNYDTIKVKPWMWSSGIRKRVKLTLRADNDNEETVWKRTDEKAPVHRHDSLNAISANLTHMADACHMQLVICQARRHGINNLMMIHDSFGTSPGEMDGLYAIVREQFINLYTHYDPFAEVQRVTAWVNEGVPERIPSLDKDGNPRLTRSGEVRTKRNPDYIDLPPLPVRGDLDLEAIADSIYSFL